MTTTGQGRAMDSKDSYEEGYTAPAGQVVSIDIKNGNPSYDKVILRAGQRVSFRNLDDRDYRLRLRHGVKGELVGACLFLQAKKTAELITDPDSCDVDPLAGHYALVEILTPGQRIYTAYSGTVGGGHGNPPRFELVVISVVKEDKQAD